MTASSTPTFTVLQGKETRDVVTPYAFSVDEQLIGLALASPIRRGVALLIDLFLVSLLTNVSSMFLAGLVSILFFRAGNRLKQKKRFNGLRILLRGLAALLLFVFALGMFEAFNDDTTYYDPSARGSNNQVKYFDADELTGSGDIADPQNAEEAMKFVGITAKYVGQAIGISKRIEGGQCPVAEDCWLELAVPVATDLGALGMSQKDAFELFSALLEQTESTLTPEQIEALKNDMVLAFKQSAGEIADKELSSDASNDEAGEGPVQKVVQTDNAPGVVDDVVQANPETEQNITDSVTESPEPENNNYSIIEWAKGIAADLGLGFGWAAFYFTAFPVWMKGYTPGKKILGIKTLKLDGTILNLWESFERYGGYGAGLATGLLGFVQIFWDPNRQAIQDKISETLVIDTRKPRVKVEVSSDGQSYQAASGEMVPAKNGS